MDFNFLDDFVDESISTKPTNLETVYYIFWEQGIDYNAFKKLPIPYILSIIKTRSWVKKEEEKEYKKAQRKR